MLNRRFSSVAVLAGSLALAACAQDGSMSKTGGGALIGALGGAAVGAATGGDTKDTAQRAAIGAAIGGLAGTAVGAYMDNQERELRQDLQGTGAELQRQGDAILVNIPSGVTFPFDSADLRPDARDSLREVARTLANNPKTTIDVTGYTDSTGPEDYNIDLSLRRAEAVMNYLIQNGVDRRRIEAFGAGEANPIASNETEYGRQQNRRVELRIEPIRANA
ncbi:Outer membrane protein [Caenispirillum salinarum AK4]|uniref:Outer membrane protein n=2 Tax=Caenispirillum TaxID=414051 RepID=K9GZH3_9PROT|nr:Outer membrane protein [Caenispirillum salinarum AK4]